MEKRSGDVFFNPAFFEDRQSRALGATIRTVRPVIKFPHHEIKLGFNIGTRGNGRDQPRWPRDLATEVLV